MTEPAALNLVVANLDHELRADRRLLELAAAPAVRLGDVQAAIDDVVCDLEVLLDWVAREEAEGVGEAPYPPNFPKMPGEPPRVQPSRTRRASAEG